MMMMQSKLLSCWITIELLILQLQLQTIAGLQFSFPKLFLRQKQSTSSSSTCSSSSSSKNVDDFFSKWLNEVETSMQQQQRTEQRDKKANPKASESSTAASLSKKEEEEEATKEQNYQFGDYTRSALLHMKASLLILLVRIVLVFHLEGYVVTYLPDQILLEIIKQCVTAKRARPAVLRIVAQELDKRIQNYKFGDLTQAAICHGLTGKSTYEFGDITRTLLQQAQKNRPEWSQRLQKEMDKFQKKYPLSS